MTIAVAGNREIRKVDLRELAERQTREALAAALEAAETGAAGSETAAPQVAPEATVGAARRQQAFLRQEDRELAVLKHQTPVPAHL